MIKKQVSKTLALILSAFILALPMVTLTNQSNVIAAEITNTPAIASSTLSAGAFHSLMVDIMGNVWAWGDNTEGQLGPEVTEANAATPVKVQGLSDVVSVAAGGAHNLALKKDGTVWAWGNNETSQLGTEVSAKNPVPTQVQGLTNIIAISGGVEHSLALTATGQVYAWGSNRYGQLNLPLSTPTSTPVILPIDNVIKISAGTTSSLLLKNDGTVWTMGAQSIKLLDDNSEDISQVVTLQQVNGLSNVVSISSGFSHNLALKNDGTVWGWGSNELFQLGSTENPFFDNPIQIKGLDNISSISGGMFLTMALKNDGSVWTLGANMYNQLGDGSYGDEKPYSPVPVKANGVDAASQITAGIGFALARGAGVHGWGDNDKGQLGIGVLGVPGTNGPNPEDYDGVNNPALTKVSEGGEIAEGQTRLAGYDAIETAIKISGAWDTGAKAVILATVGNFPDALAAATLAKRLDAPILLTDSKVLNSAVKNEIERLNPEQIIIVGGNAVVSPEIENTLSTQYGAENVKRLAGWDQFETAAKIADYFYEITPEAPRKAVLAYGKGFADALSISSWAAYNQVPILLTLTNELPEATKKALADHQISDGIIVGGRAVISSSVEQDFYSSLGANTENDREPSVQRFWGMDQYQTSTAIARGLGLNMNSVYLATGERFQDALAGSVLAARNGNPIILVDKDLTKATVSNFLSDNGNSIKFITVFGGEAVISKSAFEKMARLVLD